MEEGDEQGECFDEHGRSGTCEEAVRLGAGIVVMIETKRIKKPPKEEEEALLSREEESETTRREKKREETSHHQTATLTAAGR